MAHRTGGGFNNEDVEFDTDHHFDDLIIEYPNNLDGDFCDHLIEKFEKDDRIIDGTVGSGYMPEIKQSKDLLISIHDEWNEEDLKISSILTKANQTYTDQIRPKFELGAAGQNFEDTGYQIQKTVPGGFYSWHNDFSCFYDQNVKEIRPRLFTFIWYLNTIHEENDGYTEFISGKRVQPEQGKLLIFPATWTYFHRGVPPKNQTKYIMTGWLYTQDCP
jgi:hypothetical protein